MRLNKGWVFNGRRFTGHRPRRTIAAARPPPPRAVPVATETELKILLDTLSDYVAVRGALDGLAVDPLAAPRQAHQVNYYLDTVDRALLRQRAMARVRVADGAVEFTAKVKPRLQGGVIHVAEHQRLLSGELAAQWLHAPPARTNLAIDGDGWLTSGGVLAQPLVSDAQLFVLGAVQNLRRKVALDMAHWGGPPGVVVAELDRVHYGVGGDEAERFELEVEHPEAEALLPGVEAWLTALGVAFRRAEETKYAQFLRLSGAAGAS